MRPVHIATVATTAAVIAHRHAQEQERAKSSSEETEVVENTEATTEEITKSRKSKIIMGTFIGICVMILLACLYIILFRPDIGYEVDQWVARLFY